MTTMEIMGCEVIEWPMLKGMDIAIKQGDKLYVWPEFSPSGEFKYIEVPTREEWETELMKPRFEPAIQNMFSMRIECLFNRSLFIIP